MLLRFFRMGARLFLLLSILCCGLLAPFNFFVNPPDLTGVTGLALEDVILPAISVDNIPKTHPEYLYVHLVFTWLISIIVLSVLVRYNRDFCNLKLQYDRYSLQKTKMKKIDMRSLIVIDSSKVNFRYLVFLCIFVMNSIWQLIFQISE